MSKKQIPNATGVQEFQNSQCNACETDTSNKTVTVSNETLSFIECLRKLNFTIGSLSETLAKYYGEKQAEEIMLEKIYPLQWAVEDEIQVFLCDSITNNIYAKELTEI